MISYEWASRCQPRNCARLFDKLAYIPDFLREIGYVVLLEEVDKLQIEALRLAYRDFIPEQIKMLRKFGHDIMRAKRKPGQERFERGKIILRAKQVGVSWKQMPSHVINTHPDWFPKFKERRPTLEEKKRLAEKLRKMARDAAKRLKSEQ